MSIRCLAKKRFSFSKNRQTVFMNIMTGFQFFIIILLLRLLSMTRWWSGRIFIKIFFCSISFLLMMIMRIYIIKWLVFSTITSIITIIIMIISCIFICIFVWIFIWIFIRIFMRIFIRIFIRIFVWIFIWMIIIIFDIDRLFNWYRYWNRFFNGNFDWYMFFYFDWNWNRFFLNIMFLFFYNSLDKQNKTKMIKIIKWIYQTYGIGSGNGKGNGRIIFFLFNTFKSI